MLKAHYNLTFTLCTTESITLAIDVVKAISNKYNINIKYEMLDSTPDIRCAAFEATLDDEDRLQEFDDAVRATMKAIGINYGDRS